MADRVNSLSSGLLGLDFRLVTVLERYAQQWSAFRIVVCHSGAGMVMNDLNYRLAEEEPPSFVVSPVLFVDDNYLNVREHFQRVDSLHTLYGPAPEIPRKVASYEALVASPLVDLPHTTRRLAAIFTPEEQRGRRGRCSPIGTHRKCNASRGMGLTLHR